MFGLQIIQASTKKQIKKIRLALQHRNEEKEATT
jgi:hypothetical protein